MGVYALWLVQRQLFDGVTAAIGIPAELSAIGLLLGAAPILTAVAIDRFTKSYELVGNHTLRGTSGFIARQQRQLELSPQVHLDLEQSVAGRLLGFGTLTFWTGDDRSRMVWKNVANPTAVMGLVDSMRRGSGGVRDTQPAAGEAGFSTGLAGVPAAPPPTPEETAAQILREAKKTKSTHFGPVTAPAGAEPARYDTPFGTYVDHKDGTVSHVESNLRMIRAPWGMQWEGDRFHGVPVQLTWPEAVGLFGRGSDVGYDVGGTMAMFGEAKRQASAYAHGYEVGRCRVHFAGRVDWRLPTADELGRLSASLQCFISETRHHRTDEEFGWDWRGEKNWSLVQLLYPELFPGPQLWSATGLGGGLAWAYDGSFPVGDHETAHQRAVVFVRNEAIE